MDWAKYKDTASFHASHEALQNISDEFKEEIINFEGLFPETLIHRIFGLYPERYESKYYEEQAIRGIRYRYMSEGGVNVNGLWWDETLDFLIEHPEYAQFYEPTRMTVTETDQDYYIPIEELIEARKKELNS